MRSVFAVDFFQAEPWSPALGQVLPELITGAATGYSEYEKARIAEEQKKAEQAKAEAAKAQASTAQAQARVAEATAGGGISTTTLVLGGVGLLAVVGVIVAVAR